jgi:hypothetical protein
MKPEFKPGSLWIGGEDNYVIEILGNGHKPGLKRVRAYEPDGHTFNEVEFVGNRIARRHVWSGIHQEELRIVILVKTDFAKRVSTIRKKCEKNA